MSINKQKPIRHCIRFIWKWYHGISHIQSFIKLEKWLYIFSFITAPYLKNFSVNLSVWPQESMYKFVVYAQVNNSPCVWPAYKRFLPTKDSYDVFHGMVWIDNMWYSIRSMCCDNNIFIIKITFSKIFCQEPCFRVVFLIKSCKYQEIW